LVSTGKESGRKPKEGDSMRGAGFVDAAKVSLARGLRTTLAVPLGDPIRKGGRSFGAWTAECFSSNVKKNSKEKEGEEGKSQLVGETLARAPEELAKTEGKVSPRKRRGDRNFLKKEKGQPSAPVKGSGQSKNRTIYCRRLSTPSRI